MKTNQLIFPPLSYTGWGAIQHLLPQVERLQSKNILVISDPILVKIGIVERTLAPLQKQGLTIDIYTEVEAEPSLSNAEKLVAYTRDGAYDLVIAIGGGSVLDIAKLAAVLSNHDGDVADYLNLNGTRSITNKSIPKILIPTTSGTGSEVTNISVLSLGNTKDAVVHNALLADVAIVDPELTVTVPPKITAATGVDAFVHALEAYISVNAGPVSDALAIHAMRLISGSIRTAVTDGKNQQARTDMSMGSYIAGLAFFNAGVAGVHALAYPLGGQFHIPHGDSNAVLLPYVMSYIRSSCQKRLGDVLNAMGMHSAFYSEKEASIKCIIELKRMVKDVGIPSTLKDFNIPASALPLLADDGIKQKRLLSRSPMALDRDDILAIYQSAFNGKITL